MNTEKDVFVLLRISDEMQYVYNLPDGRQYKVVYNSENGTAGFVHMFVGCAPAEAAKMFKYGVALRYATQEEMDRNIQGALAIKAATRTGELQ